MINSLKLKFGRKALFRNPLRIIVSIITAIIAIGIAGMCIFTGTYSMIPWERDMFFNAYEDPYINLCLDTGVLTPQNYNIFIGGAGTDCLTKEKYFSMIDSVEEIGGGYATMYWSTYSSSPERNFSVYNLFNYLGVTDTVKTGEEALYAEYNGETIIAPYANFRELSVWDIVTQRGMVSKLFFSAVTVYSGENALEDFGYTLVGKLPEEINEVAIPQWLYNSFLCYGYRNPDTGEEIEISSEEDIIGKTLLLTGDKEYSEYKKVEATIVGVIRYDMNDNFFNDLGFDSNGKLVDISSIYSLPPYLGVAVSKAFLDSGRMDPEDYYASGGAYVNCITVSRTAEHAEEYFDYATAWKKDKSFFDITDPEIFSMPNVKYAVSSQMQNLYGKLPNVFNQTTIYFQIIRYTTPFAFVLLIYFAFSTVFGRRKDIGIFRSMGMNKTKIWLSFLVPLAAVAIMASLGGMAIEIGFMNYMNAELLSLANVSNFVGYYPFTLNAPTLLFTFLSPLVTVTITSAVTLLFLTRKSICSLIAK